MSEGSSESSLKGFRSQLDDPDLQHVSAALLRAGHRAQEIARQTGTGIAIEVDGDLRILRGEDLAVSSERPPPAQPWISRMPQ
jgi:hypothetical protein